jgi:predicted  nucleic acid-binding Zn-ribbon protein
MTTNDRDDKISRAITRMGPVSVDEHEALKTRVYSIGDKQQDLIVEVAKLLGRVESAEESIDRLRTSSATSEQVTAATTIMTLKLNHLLEKQEDMKKQIGNVVWRLALWSIVGGLVAVGLALGMGWIAFT